MRKNMKKYERTKQKTDVKKTTKMVENREIWMIKMR